MNGVHGRWSRPVVLGTVVGVALGAWIVAAGPANVWAEAQGNFMGGSPSREPSEKVSTLRLKFPKGVRSNWHSHSWGQLLMVEQGHGLTQERGAQLRIVSPGEPWFTTAGVEHWHGAATDEDMLQLTIYEGDVKWLEPVTDAQYRAAPRK